MPEWLKGAVLKTVVAEMSPGVRIPLPPQIFRIRILDHSFLAIAMFQLGQGWAK